MHTYTTDKIMGENFLNWAKEKKLQVQEPKISPRHIKIKIKALKTKYNKTIFKVEKNNPLFIAE